MEAVGYPPDYDAGCHTDVFSAVLIIQPDTGSAVGMVQGACGVQWTELPAGACRSNRPTREGYSCVHVRDGVIRVASTSSSEPTRSFYFGEITASTWFFATGVGAGAG